MKKGIVTLISSIKIVSNKKESVETGVNKDDLVSKESKVLGKYKEFLQAISNDTELMSKNNSESSAFITVLESLPYVKDDVVSDLRYEAIIRKLVGHIYHNLVVINNEKQIKTECLKTSIWIVKSFRTMIENRMGMSIYERDEDGGEEQDEAAWPVVNALNECGATALCLDLIAVGIDDDLQAEAIRLLVGMLFKEGGAIEVQTTIYNHLTNNNSIFFFKQVTIIIQKLIGIHNWNGVVVTKEGEEPNINPSFLVIRMLQLMCEGHYLPNQKIMCEQAHNEQSYNLLNEFVNFLNCLTRLPCRTSTVAALSVAATILEVIQGPCVINQQHFAINTEILECLNRLLRSKAVHDCVEEEEITLKKTAIDILEGLLEGQGLKSAIYDRLLSVVHLDVIQYLSGTVEDDEVAAKQVKDEDEDDEEEEAAKVEKSEEVISLQTECIVLLQMLCNYQPALRAQLGLSEDLAEIAKTGTASVEVIWHGVLQRRFFHIPELCHDIAKTSKDKLIEEIDRSSVENRLNDFIQRSHELYREVKHIQVLRDYRLISIFNAANLDKMTWLSFCLACTINTLLLCYFYNDRSEPTLNEDIIPVIYGISVLQIVIAGIVLLMYFFVRIPVVFKTYQSQGYSFNNSVTYTLLDGMFLYYTGYFVFTVLGIVVSNYVFTPVLLLDIVVKNSTTRDVLYSIYIPRKQLSLTLLFCAFTTYTYSFYIFLFFPGDLTYPQDCKTLWNCMKAVTRYGLSSAGGAGDIMYHTLGSRYLLDLTFFLVVLIVVLNLIFGIIINAFSSLREESKARIANTTETCFICGIDNQTFDRASSVGDGFKTHIKYEHHVWNYLYYIFFLWEQDKDDDDGLEQYIRRCVTKEDVIWMPMNKAICLDFAATDDEAFQQNLVHSIADIESQVTEQLQGLESEISVVLEQVIQKLKVDDTTEDTVIAALPPPVIVEHEISHLVALKNLSIQITDIYITSDEDLRAYIVINSDVDSYEVMSHSFFRHEHKLSITFPDTKFLLCVGSHPEDRRQITVDIYLLKHKEAGSDAEEEEEEELTEDDIYGTAEITLDAGELYVAESEYVLVPFEYKVDGHINPGHVCNIEFLVKCVE